MMWILPTELLMKMWLKVLLEMVYPAIQSQYDTNWIHKNLDTLKPDSEERSFPLSVKAFGL
jgi:hypothetical protein